MWYDRDRQRREREREPELAAPGDNKRAGYEFRAATSVPTRETDVGSYDFRQRQLAKGYDVCPVCGALRGQRCRRLQWRFVKGSDPPIEALVPGGSYMRRFHKERRRCTLAPPRTRRVRRPAS
jgi:hypothetical protein